VSKQRQRDRAAREAAQAAERERRAAAKAKAQRQERRKPALPERPKRAPVYRQRRFPPLPWRFKLALAIGWLTAVVLVVLFVPTWTGRIGFVVLATFALPLIVVIVRDPSRRTR
jgi:Flp pilus assembly protein TadB